MRIVKEADERKNEILDTVASLFAEKGYNETSISDIIDKVKIARGTVYYHFKSKEDILDALIKRISSRFMNAAKKIAEDKSIPVFERLLNTMMTLVTGSNIENRQNEYLLKHIHKPQNALMHQKIHDLMLKSMPPILTGIIEDGIREGLFNTPYPYESLEMVTAHIIMVFDYNYMPYLSQEEQMKRIHAFIFNMERLLGVKSGSFAPMLILFRLSGENNEVSHVR